MGGSVSATLAHRGAEHNRKPNSPGQGRNQPSPTDLRGTGAKYGLVDCIISIVRPSDRHLVKMRIESRDCEEIQNLEIEIAGEDDSGPKIRIAQSREAKLEKKARKEQLHERAEEGRWLTAKEARALIEKPPHVTTVRKYLDQLVKDDRWEVQGKTQDRKWRKKPPD